LVHTKGARSHAIVDKALLALERLEHRGASGREADSGDGAGVLIQIPDRLFQREAAMGRIELDGKPVAKLPAEGDYAVGLFLGSQDSQASALAKLIFAMIVRQEGLKLLGWRRVPTDNRELGLTARSVEPTMDHVFLAPTQEGTPEDVFERRLFIARKRFQSLIKSSGIDDRQYFHVPSLSSRTLVYKGMLTPRQVRDYFGDLSDAKTESALALFHSRFSTNTFPSWELAHPYRLIAHNGEINTLRGNVNWMRAREALLSSSLFGPDIEKIFPIVHEGLSDSACLDSVLELLVRGGRSLPHAVMMLLPEAWEHNPDISPELRAFYQFHACLVEPWDGPACVTFTDGVQIGAVLDRNGLRPGRYVVTDDDLVMLASETGVLDVDPDRIVEKGRLRPGHMFLVDTSRGRIVPDAEIKAEMAKAAPYAEWLAQHLRPLSDLPAGEVAPPLSKAELERRLYAFGVTEEELRMVVAPMAEKGEEPTLSMGNDAALAVLSDQPRPLSDYFKQLFAQVTNPPLDAIREKLVTSLATAIGPEGNLLEGRPESAHLVFCDTPFLDNEELAKFRLLQRRQAPSPDFGPTSWAPGSLAGAPAHFGEGPFGVTVLDMVFPVDEGNEGLEPALSALFAKADNAIANGSKVLVLSDRAVGPTLAPIPALLAVAGLHNHLVRERRRTQVTLIVETGALREVHQAALLLGYGASAVNPYLALEALGSLAERGFVPADVDRKTLERNFLRAIEKGVVKVMSKMGISTVASYRGAQIFEAVGLGQELVDRYFTLTPSRVGGIGIRDVADEVVVRHRRAYQARKLPLLPSGGQLEWRQDGEFHLFNPETVKLLQHATRTRKREIFRSYTRAVDDQATRMATLRSLLNIKRTGTPVPLEEVEPVEAILPRFATGAMSYGSISQEAHETLAIAMNRIGGRSNSGEGGEDPRRAQRDPNGDWRRSAIKQVASARFGVTSFFLTQADELQIKMAQGAKPGEGGQLPGHKVYPHIAAVRHSTPGVTLISPPPHHDIYSIEDLAQLIYDLRSANAQARISVKLVAEVGVGTVAAGVVKAKSDVVLIAGHDGGTGASPVTSIRHAGAPWELGLAEAQQVLVKNGLRERVVLQADGQMKTPRDVLIAALLGAEEFGFSTAPLVVMGCIMMRVCHLDTCPVGVATQNPDLRARFTGKAEHVVAFFRFVAEELRVMMAELGFRSMDELIGRVDLLEQRRVEHPKASKVDLGAILDASHLAAADGHAPPLRSKRDEKSRLGVYPLHDRRMTRVEEALHTGAEPALFYGEAVQIAVRVSNQDRAIGTRLGSEITRRYGEAGLPEGTVRIQLTGSAGQSLAAFAPRGITITCEGDANDYVGKGLSGAILAVRPPRTVRFDAEENVIVGNVALYGATSGRAFFSGKAGERFAVRNSGATAVVEGCGAHGCEYMTGGVVLVLGRAGRNFGAGMSGGVAFVVDADGTFAGRVNGSPEGLTQAPPPAEQVRRGPHPPRFVNLELVDVGPPAPEDEARIQALLLEHKERTGSKVAERALADLPAFFATLVRVSPKRAAEAAAPVVAPAPVPPVAAE
jgi:glutamate synthase (ferredoxin)